MSIFLKVRPLAIASGVALMLPAAMAAADEPIRLDANQLDSIVAGDILVGIKDLDAFGAGSGFVSLNTTAFSNVQTNANPGLGIAVGTAGATALALGNDDGVGPVAVANTSLGGTEGKVLVDRTFGRNFGRSGTFAGAFEYRVVVAVDDSYGIF